MIKSKTDGFSEAGTGFGAGETLETYEALYRLVLTAYGYRCALTGEQFEPSIGLLHPTLEVVAIRPREVGGPLQINNYIALEASAASAFRAGQILIEDDYNVIADVNVLGRGLAMRLHPSGRLVVPAEPLFRPNSAHLAFHRRSVLGG